MQRFFSLPTDLASLRVPEAKSRETLPGDRFRERNGGAGLSAAVRTGGEAAPREGVRAQGIYREKGE